MKLQQAGDRIEVLRRGVTKELLGLEVGPFFRPICPKKEGFNVITLDVFSREQLIEIYFNDPNVRPHFNEIEEVDIVSSKPLLEAIKSSDIRARMSGSAQEPLQDIFDYIVTSHHFEHLPNPIQFLQDVELLLRPGGSLNMAIPIHTRCFDLYKPLSTTGSFIDAYMTQQAKPSLGTVFNHFGLIASKKDGSPIGSPHLDPSDVTLTFTDFERFQTSAEKSGIAWFEQLQEHITTRYIDSHCHHFNPISFYLILTDLRMLGLVKELQVHDICENGLEFVVHLQKSVPQHDHPFGGMSRTALVQAASIYSAAEILPAIPTVQ